MRYAQAPPPAPSHRLFSLPQADTKPGCVLRPANVVEVLQRKRGLLTNDDVETCKGGMNTWGYVGDLNDHPQLSCVYQSDDAQNEFLSNPKVGHLQLRTGITRFALMCHVNGVCFEGISAKA